MTTMASTSGAIPLGDSGVDLREIKVWNRLARPSVPVSGGHGFMSGSGAASSPEKMRKWLESLQWLCP